MKITIHQPNFLPYLGFFDKCDYADLIVLYDSTQFKKNDFQNRNKLKTKEGWTWITIPVSYNFGDKISEVKIANNFEWKRRHLDIIKENYSKSKYYLDYIGEIEKIYSGGYENLSEFNIVFLKFLLDKLGIKKKIILTSELDIKKKSSEALLEISLKLNANTYISGIDGKNYLNRDLFNRAKIDVEFQEYKHPEYTQFGTNFEPFMSILDLLFNEGPNSLNIIKSGRYYTK